MESIKTSSELKSIAKGRMMGKYAVAIGAILLIVLMSLGSSFLLSMILVIPTTMNKIIFTACSLILSLLFCIFSVGLVRMFLNMSRNMQYGITDIFYGFTHRPDRTLGAAVILYLIGLACMLPYLILMGLYDATANLPFGVIGLAAGVAGGIIAVILMLGYSQVYYLLADREDLTAIETLRTSKEMMAGHKARYFYLTISFFGWLLLSIFSCYIGLLWLIPYMEMTMTTFYQNLTCELR